MNDDCGKLYATVERKNRNQRGEVRLKFSLPSGRQLPVSPELGKAPYLTSFYTFFFVSLRSRAGAIRRPFGNGICEMTLKRISADNVNRISRVRKKMHSSRTPPPPSFSVGGAFLGRGVGEGVWEVGGHRAHHPWPKRNKTKHRLSQTWAKTCQNRSEWQMLKR